MVAWMQGSSAGLNLRASLEEGALEVAVDPNDRSGSREQPQRSWRSSNRRQQSTFMRTAAPLAVTVGLALSLAPAAPAFADGGAGGGAGTGVPGGIDSATGVGANGSPGGIDNTIATGGGGGGAGATGGVGGNGANFGFGAGAGGAGGNIAGASGANGGNATGGATGGGGGGGGAQGPFVSTSGALSSATGGNGGHGGNGPPGFSVGGGGGGGGGGYGTVVTVGGLSLTSSGTIAGGNGGNGGNNPIVIGGASGGDGGGGGPGLVFTSTAGSLANAGTLAGGAGGRGGTGGFASSNGGDGGAAVVADRMTITNSGTIAGGNGGAGGAGAHGTGQAGAGGVGIAGFDMTVINNGTISGGLSGDGVTRRNALSFTGGNNTLTLQTGWSLMGGIFVASNLTFNQSILVTLSNEIGGAGSIIQQGPGTLVLTGDNSYTGTTTVAAGTLVVNGSVANSAVAVQSGAVLGGQGRIGDLTAQSGGIVAPGVMMPFTTLNVAGNASFGPGSTFLVNVNPAGQNDKLAIGGRATLSGGTVEVLAGSGTYTPATRFTLLTAGGGVSGTFAALQTSSNTSQAFAFLTPSLSYDANDVFLGFTQITTNLSSVAGTGNQASTAAAVQALGFGNPIFDAVVGQSVNGARQAFIALSGEVHASAVTAAFEDSRLPREAILDRLSQPFTGPTLGSTMAAYAADLPTKARPAVPRAEPQVISFWGHAFGDFGRNGSDGNAASISRSTDGFVIGGDVSAIGVAGGDWRFGAAGGYTYDSFSVADRSSSGNFRSGFGAIYGGANFGALQLRSGATFGVNTTVTGRQIIFPGFAQGATSSYGGSTVQGFGEAGYRFALTALPRLGISRATLEPFVGAAAIHIHQDGFNELGGVAALSGFGQDFDLGTTTLGLRAESTFIGPLPLTARALLGWRHAYGDVVPTALLAFQGPTQPFSVAGVPIDRDAFVTEVGLDYTATSSTTLGIAYSGQYGQRATDNAIKAHLDYRF